MEGHQPQGKICSSLPLSFLFYLLLRLVVLVLLVGGAARESAHGGQELLHPLRGEVINVAERLKALDAASDSAVLDDHDGREHPHLQALTENKTSEQSEKANG